MAAKSAAFRSKTLHFFSSEDNSPTGSKVQKKQEREKALKTRK
jgi:hypothetical protein